MIPTATQTPQTIEKKVVNVISNITKLHPDRLIKVRDLTALGLTILDVVDVILKLEKTYQLTIPDEVPVYTLDDFVNFIHQQLGKPALVQN